MDSIIQYLNQILLTGNEMPEAIAVVKVDKLLYDVLASSTRLIKDSKAKINYNFTDVNELVTVRQYLFGIFHELITDIIKHAAGGDNPPLIDIWSELDNENVVINFRDNEIAFHEITEESIEVDQRVYLSEEISGLEMHMTKKLLEVLNGKMEVEKKPGEGTIYRLIFIANKEPAQTNSPINEPK